MIALRCPVRGCGAPLRREGARLLDDAGHSFDLAKSGYVNLLQPQDRRSLRPGDPDEAVAARRRLFDAGAGAALIDALAAAVGGLGLPAGARTLDLGSGEGSILGALALRLGLEAVGVELSARAADLAARRFPGVLWVVANADRALPLADASVDLVLSVAARRNPAECARVLAPGGRLVVALPAPDDLAELREAVLGGAAREERADKVVREHAGRFALVSRGVVRERRDFPAAQLADLLAATYRGGRAGRRERAAGLDGLAVTQSQELLVFALTAPGVPVTP
jgi:23S rRNA (guanine745-N1)-methyltransferase